MPTSILSPNELKKAVRESIREVLAQELLSLRALVLPFVSSKEQKDIERRYGAPSKKIVRKLEIHV